MDFIKKHYEKILLAVALLVLIGVAVALVLKVSDLSAAQDREFAGARKATGAAVTPTPVDVYTNAIAALKQPSTWAPGGLSPFERPVTNFVVVEIPVVTNMAVLPPLVLQEIVRNPFKLRFQSYTGTGEKFQVNFLPPRNRSFFVPKVGMPIGDEFETTGYVITKFSQIFTNIFNQKLFVTNQVDVSQLTIHRDGDDPILLVLGRVTEEKEPMAKILCTADNNPFFIRKGEEFNCNGKTYKVVDIDSTQVLIESQSGKKHTIDFNGAKE